MSVAPREAPDSPCDVFVSFGGHKQVSNQPDSLDSLQESPVETKTCYVNNNELLQLDNGMLHSSTGKSHSAPVSPGVWDISGGTAAIPPWIAAGATTNWCSPKRSGRFGEASHMQSWRAVPQVLSKEINRPGDGSVSVFQSSRAANIGAPKRLRE